jgi:hypothetical protein
MIIFLTFILFLSSTTSLESIWIKVLCKLVKISITCSRPWWSSCSLLHLILFKSYVLILLFKFIMVQLHSISFSVILSKVFFHSNEVIFLLILLTIIRWLRLGWPSHSSLVLFILLLLLYDILRSLNSWLFWLFFLFFDKSPHFPFLLFLNLIWACSFYFLFLKSFKLSL